MDRYDYRDALYEDIKDYIRGSAYAGVIISDSDSDKLYDELFVADSVTGNGSGSYTFSRRRALPTAH